METEIFKEKIENAFKNKELILCCSKSHQNMKNSGGNFPLEVRLPGLDGNNEKNWLEIISNEVNPLFNKDALRVNVSKDVLKNYIYSHSFHPKELKNLYSQANLSYNRNVA